MGPNSLGVVFVLFWFFFFQEGHCLRAQLSEPGTALWACGSRADRKGFQSSCFECRIVCRGSAAYQWRAERSQCSNPGFVWVTSTGEAWKTWFIPLPEVPVGMIQTQPAVLSRNHRQGLRCWKGRVWCYHLNSPGSRSFQSKLCWLSLLSIFFSPLLVLTHMQECFPCQQELGSSLTTEKKWFEWTFS